MGQRAARLEGTLSFNCLAFQFLWNDDVEMVGAKGREARNILFAGRPRRRRALVGGLSAAFDSFRCRSARGKREKGRWRKKSDAVENVRKRRRALE